MIKKLTLSLIGILLSAVAFPALSTATCTLQLDSESHLRLDGDSSLHKFSAVSNRMTGEVEVEADGGSCIFATVTRITKLTFRLPVTGLKSEKEGLNDNMYEDLKAKRFPEILFVLSRPAGIANGAFELEGELTVAGVAKKISVHGAFAVRNGKLCLNGTENLKMTDFNIEPRTLFLGTIKTYDAVSVTFQLVFSLPQEEREAPSVQEGRK